jgi:hypothetical protein
MKERRAKDRRNLTSKLAHTAESSKGRILNVDRRRAPDRRLNNIHVEFISIDDFYLKSSNSVYHS